MIKAIILDMGGVVLTSQLGTVLEEIAKKLSIDPKEFGHFYYRYKQELQSGKLKVSDFAKLVQKEFKPTKEIIPIWTDAYLRTMTLNLPLLNLIENLRNKYKIGCITNTTDLHAQLNKERKAFRYFDEVIISCDVGLVKPNKEIFELMLKKLNVKAKDCIFVDDHENHVQAAEKLGMNGIVFRNTSEFIQKLKVLGINLK